MLYLLLFRMNERLTRVLLLLEWVESTKCSGVARFQNLMMLIHTFYYNILLKVFF